MNTTLFKEVKSLHNFKELLLNLPPHMQWSDGIKNMVFKLTMLYTVCSVMLLYCFIIYTASKHEKL